MIPIPLPLKDDRRKSDRSDGAAAWSGRPPDEQVPVSALLESGKVRLNTLVGLRWLAVAGQTLTIMLVYFGLGFPLELVLCLGIIGASVALNVALSLRFPPTRRLTDTEAASYLAFDVVQLSALLMLTGGLQNPFALLFLAPATISATTLSLRSTLIVCGLTMVGIALISLAPWPLPWYPGESFVLPELYMIGHTVALILGVGFTAGYAWRVSAETNRMSRALAATQFVLAREQKLSALGGLAAAAAHELGTPLGTIAVTAKELERELGQDSAHAEDLALIRDQAKRCREILMRLAQSSDAEDAHYSRLSLPALLEEIAEPHSGFGVAIAISARPAPGAAEDREPQIWRRPEILYGLGNLLENAVDFARADVRFDARWTDGEISIEIRDDGPGFSQEIMDLLGEPYVTTRGSDGRIDPPYHDPDGHQGMGLGFFIAKTLIERTGGQVSFGNVGAEGTLPEGALVRVLWPRSAIEARRPEG
ncbi:MAG: ActS/PrrB/RegB family redox-sensitive histidine kinase [Alphaproteobacteria bacterium]|nr:ActS/PrrB/RegB family redox-sensitive histidine kinase [Alphaproteobacteria bacterium]